MIPAYTKIPYAIPFSFSSVDDDNRLAAEILVPYDVAVYAITMAVSSSPQAAFYHSNIQFTNYHTGSVLFDQPLQNGCLQTDARTPFYLPSCWWIRKNQKIICSLDSFDNVTARTYYITLLGYVSETDPNPGKQPFVYSFPIFVGFQDNVSGSTATLPFHQGGTTGALAKPALYDFEFCAMVLDPFGGDLSTTPQTPDNQPSMSLKVSTQSRETRKVRNFIDRFTIDGCIGGGSAFSQGDLIPLLPTSGNNIRGFPEDNIQQYWLPEKEFIPKWDMIRVDLAPSPTFIISDDIHTLLNQQCCMAIIGNHLG